MRQAVLTGISALLMAVLLPGWLLPSETLAEQKPFVLIIDQPLQKKEQPMISVGCGDSVLSIPLEEYLTGVLLSEMPASFHIEALKAQAVAARTFALKQMEGGKHADFDVCMESNCCQTWNSKENTEVKLGKSAAAYWDKAEQAVTETEGEVLSYHGSLIDAVYFSCSGGSTEDAVAVWGSEVPYLQSVSSDGEENARVFETEKTVSLDQFRQVIQEISPDSDLSGKPEMWFGKIQYTDGGGVDTVEIGGKLLKGTMLRSAFGLNSTKFSCDLNKNEIVFHVKGYGHRVGLSQYGANAMAENGKNYREILLHYYTGTEICCVK